MNLEEQVVSLELAKDLKNLGIKQISLFSWIKSSHPKSKWFLSMSEGFNNTYHNEYISAYTTAELGEMLPCGIYAASSKDENGWYMQPISPLSKWKEMYPCNTEANARAKMLIHLIENGILKI